MQAQNATWNNIATSATHTARAVYPDTLANEVLLEKCRQGDTKAMHQLLSRYEGLIQGLAYRLAGNYDDASDVAAEAYVRLCTMLGSCRSAAALPSWISRVVSNAFCDLRRRAQRTPAVSLDKMIEESGEGCLANQENKMGSPELHIEADERKQILNRAIKALPEHQQDIINLFYQEEYTHEEISQMMGIAVGTVKSRLNRAREALQQRLSVHQSVLTN